ncbi:MAG TPA: hypothetical protein VNS22_17530 [Geminicoccus sp.]|uniref:hypothetical protein n=1 Tax=Geminicoccus sp. TaxID=2024832 RepID=UPI002CC45D81|nr:hypothetical protein [Geminicoccus sp.]HWL70167.1 hypothetical protein [Geminicoccus sp.]
MNFHHVRGRYLPLLWIAPAASHDWYEGLRAPSGDLCCNQNDCRSVPYRFNTETGTEETQVDGRWWPINPEQVVPSAAPDGQAHACWSSYIRNPTHTQAKIPTFRCIILPRMSSLAVAITG